MGHTMTQVAAAPCLARPRDTGLLAWPRP